MKTSQSSSTNEGSLTKGNKKSVVSVVLTEEATIPGQFFFLCRNIDMFCVCVCVYSCKVVYM